MLPHVVLEEIFFRNWVVSDNSGEGEGVFAFVFSRTGNIMLGKVQKEETRKAKLSKGMNSLQFA